MTLRIRTLPASGAIVRVWLPLSARALINGSLIGSVVPGLNIPNVVLVMFGAALIASFVLSRTILGRYTFALGSNEEATRLSGVNVDAWKIGVYSLCGLFSGLAPALSTRIRGA